MSFIAFIIWVLIVAGTGYMLWKLFFEGRGGKQEDVEPMAVKTEQPSSESAEEEPGEEFSSDVAEAQEEPPTEVEEEEDETLEEADVIEGEAEEVEEKEEKAEEVEEPEKEK